MPSVTRLRICSETSSSASVSRTQANAFSRRASGSSSSSSSTLRSTDRSGAQPAVSASAPGSSTPARASAMRGLPSFSAMPRTTARYSRTISRARPLTAAGSATGSASTHTPGSSVGTVRPMAARDRPRSTRARCPPGSSPSFSMRATVPMRVYPLPTRGTRRMRRSPAMAPSAASRPSALSSARVTTICGNTTPVFRGSRGRRRPSSWGGVSSGVASGLASVIGGLQWISVITPLREIHNRPQPACIPDTYRRISISHQRQKVAICFRSGTNRYLSGAWAAFRAGRGRASRGWCVRSPRGG